MKNNQETGVKGYKVFFPDWTCGGGGEPFQYKVGEIFEEDVIPSLCNKGFHFCKKLVDCFCYYGFNPDFKVAEIIALGEVCEGDNKCCTNKIKIVKEISWHEVLDLVNIGEHCSGLCNSGDNNSGDCNTGNNNSGNNNSDDHNSGNNNSGYRNNGNYNSGNYNSGYCNSGNYNSGRRNSGNHNRGNYNTGDYNKTSYASGCFNTEVAKITFFDKPSDMTFEEWDNSEASYILSGGKNITTEWWNELSNDDKNIIKAIPNFDAEKFSKITGIDAEAIIGN